MDYQWHMVVLTTDEINRNVHEQFFADFQIEWKAAGCPIGCTIYADGVVEFGTEVFYLCPRAVELAPDAVRKYAGTPCSSPVGVRLWAVAGDITDRTSGIIYGTEACFIPRPMEPDYPMAQLDLRVDA
jgi:hypothetical protein